MEYATKRNTEGGTKFGIINHRVPLLESIDPSRGRREVKLNSRGVDAITIGTTEIDLIAVEQLVDPGQLKAIALALVEIKKKYAQKQLTIAEILHQMESEFTQSGLDTITDYPQGDLTLFRSLELAAALNRLRSLQIR